MNRTLYFVCRSTGYGNFHTPIYVETDSRKAEELKNELQGLYDALRRQKRQSIYECYVASVRKVVTRSDCSRYLATIYNRKPLYVVTDLDHRAIFYFEKDKDIMMKYHEEDRGKYSWYKSEPFRLDYDEEIKNIRQMINSESEDEYI